MNIGCKLWLHKWQRRTPIYERNSCEVEYKEQCVNCLKIRYRLVMLGVTVYGGDYFRTIKRFTSNEAIQAEVLEGIHWLQK